MSYELKSSVKLCMLFLTAIVILAPAVAVAQRPRTGVERRQQPGKGFWANQRAARSVQHSRDYAHGIYQYSKAVRTIQPSVAKAESEALGRNIAKAQQELTVVRQEVGSDPAAAASLKAIDNHLSAAAKQHEMLHMECCKDAVDGMACLKHCSQILLELDKAKSEHDAMMRSTEVKAINANEEAAAVHKEN